VLQLAVPGRLTGMRTQEITQVDVITMRPASRHHDIQMVIDGIGRRCERFPARDAQIPLMPPPGRGQRLNRRTHGCITGNHHVKVDDRLGVQPGDRGTADMLGHMRHFGQRGINPVTQLPERARPPRIVGHHYCRNIHNTIMPQRASQQPSPHGEVAKCRCSISTPAALRD